MSEFIDLSHDGHMLFVQSSAIRRKMLTPLPDVPMEDQTPGSLAAEGARSLPADARTYDVTKIATPAPLRTYDVTDEQFKAVDNRFVYHQPNPDQAPRYVAMREKFRELAHFILAHTPPSREQSHALTLLDDASFNANASIARNE